MFSAEREAARDLVLDQRAVQHPFGPHEATIAAADLGEIIIVEFRIVGDHRNRAAHHVAPEQCPLRAAQHFDAVGVIEVGVQVVVEHIIDVVHEIGDRRVQRSGAECRHIATDRDDRQRLVGGVYGDARHLLRQRGGAVDLRLAQQFAAESRNGKRHFAHRRFAPFGGDDDVLGEDRLLGRCVLRHWLIGLRKGRNARHGSDDRAHGAGCFEAERHSRTLP